ncbi:MAG: Vitamin B12-binding protein [Chroococcidiopsis sp. SAG 2025]|uniref:ABC transporter substrate-binding protein n=1 Tax=Chroococcidiopsis sp. SAG 2025 TaxID=171389 RepID=UPI002936E36C|nr:ABC transporter substrate-binding protein [Chroococcidiopsis sp. SAG 2025]MDV2994838.1 Vitamin B12-binding protein [Chroococcidiopsis sp. SAG 2025]
MKWRNLAIVLLLVILSGCGDRIGKPIAQTRVTDANYSPVKIDNCGITATYKQPPKRAVALNQPATEVLLALGLEERTIGTAYLDDRIPPQYQKAYEKIPVLAKQYPSREVLLTSEPDFVYGSFPGAFGSNDRREREDLSHLGIQSYLSLQNQSLCKTKERPLENLYNEVREIGRIFGVETRSQQLIASWQAQIAETQRKLGKIETPKRVFWYADEDPPYTVTQSSLPNQILELAGGRNIFQLGGEDTYIKVNWEDVITRNPEVIVISEAFWSLAQRQVQLFQTNLAFSQLKAVQQQRFIIIKYRHSTSVVSIAEGIGQLARELYPERFK